MEQHKANQAFWDAITNWWKDKEDSRGLWMKAHENPSLVLSPSVLPFVENIHGKEACVLGSGDNEVAFALVGLGANVTSVDISKRRLEVASERAHTLGLKVSFVQADVTDLSALEDDRFDLAYTGGHMSVWISDITKYYAEAARILKPGGIFIVDEYHPIRRMWSDSERLETHHRYLERGPYKYTSPEGLPTFEYHWTVADHIQAVIDAGCRVVKVDEYGEGGQDEFWLQVDLSKLPRHLVIVGRKEQPR